MMSATDFKVLGMPMQRQKARRQLVVWTYVVLGLICAVVGMTARTYPLLYSYAIYPSLAVAMFVFGGSGRGGLLKAFANKPPRPDPPQIEIIKLRLAPETLVSSSESGWKNDERELSRRDRAHYEAYKFVGICPILMLLLSALALSPKHHFFSSTTWLLTIFGLAEVMTVLALTLPAAIILWTEPDMDAD
jgi:hypothetical protein